MNDAASPDERSPAWRHDCATELAHQQRVLLQGALDEPTRQLASFLRREQACRDEATRHQWRQKHADTAAALQLYRDPDLRDLACTVEAMILARMNKQAIADCTGISPAAVGCYQTYCFAVGNQLDRRAYVLNSLLLPELRRRPGGRPARRRFLTKVIGYYCGAAALRDVFGWEAVTLRAQWVGPEQAVRQLTATAWLDGIAQVLDDSSSLSDPGRLLSQIDQIIAAVQELQVRPWPQSPLEMLARGAVG